ncbi:hypothetical protein V6N11_045007 [Hibiscus sabdariffa]|uniref:Uncharacterized protein n=1 Tax=Hibiscus sabdariffa TaxID=183260 RepID=A0ABR2PV95_9ROSI
MGKPSHDYAGTQDEDVSRFVGELELVGRRTEAISAETAFSHSSLRVPGNGLVRSEGKNILINDIGPNWADVIKGLEDPKELVNNAMVDFDLGQGASEDPNRMAEEVKTPDVEALSASIGNKVEISVDHSARNLPDFVFRDGEHYSLELPEFQQKTKSCYFGSWIVVVESVDMGRLYWLEVKSKVVHWQW